MTNREVKLEEIEMNPYKYGLPISYEYFRNINKLTLGQLNKEKEYFSIRNQNNERILYAMLDIKSSQRLFCANDRSFAVTINTFNTKPFLRIIRDFKLCAWCACMPGFGLLDQKVRVETPDGMVIGTIANKTTFDNTKYEVNDINGNTLIIERIPRSSDTYGFRLWTASGDKLLGETSRSPLYPRQEMDYYSLNCKRSPFLY
jgi:hypothetical protein